MATIDEHYPQYSNDINFDLLFSEELFYINNSSDPFSHLTSWFERNDDIVRRTIKELLNHNLFDRFIDYINYNNSNIYAKITRDKLKEIWSFL